ncbi:hypothetical protein [Fundidesulfovibrio terrae]|uniref:hypothetical protein n=1 Tax=Fundidesulfovibrio terrae TaxID=2922866 RepID=UPI001FB020FA|nr:hypothetical protein [Fundidesulfovibrio terrae]
MKKAVILAVASCLLMSSVAFAFEGKSSSSDKSSYTEMMKKKKKSKKATAPQS